MSLNQYTQKIDRYLSKNEGLPIVVDVQNEADQIELVQHYHVGKNELITASKYCAPDEMPRYEELLNDLATLDRNRCDFIFEAGWRAGASAIYAEIT